MKSITCFVIASAILSVGLSLEVSAATSLTLDTDGQGRPVTKVVNLLKDMLEQMEKEAEEDEEIYEKLVCWCETGDKEKTKAIADAETRIADLTSKIEELTGLSAQLGAEIANLESEVAKNQDALEKATAMRAKELAEFNEQEKDLLGSIAAMKSAITVLSKHQSAAMFLQMDKSAKQLISAKIHHAMKKHHHMLKHRLSDPQQRVVAAFLQSPEDGLFETAPSSEIFGILSQMKETFETNLANSQKEEKTNAASFEELKAAKEDEIAAGQKMLEEKKAEHASTDEKNAQAAEDLDDTKTTLTSDEEFLANLKSTCASLDAEFENRKKTRQMEMAACSKALAVLNSDEAHDLFSKTFAFVQVKTETNTAAEMKMQMKRRMQASSVLSLMANKWKNPRMVAMAVRVKLDAFGKVKKAINDMISALMEEKKAEIKKKDFCIEEFNTNAKETERKEVEKTDTAANIEDYKSTIESLTTAIEGLTAELDELATQLKRAGEDREAENKEFQKTVAEQRGTQKILKKALEVLEGFYKKAAAASLAQVSAGAPPPPGFKPMKSNAASGGVMGMIQDIIDEAKALEAEATRNEKESQEEYEAYVSETNASVDAKTKDMTNKNEEKAKTEAALVEAEKTMESLLLELEQLANYKLELKQECDFLLKNFETRQSSRDEEVEALKQALSILSGAKFDSLLQQGRQ